MFYHSSFEMAQIQPQPVYIYNAEDPCMFYLKDGDTSNPSAYGECEIDFTGAVNWFMMSG